MTREIAFLDKVKVSSKLWRSTEYTPHKVERDGMMISAGSRRKKAWKNSRYIKPRVGVVIGFRNLANGWTSWDSECGYEFIREEGVKAALVVFNEKERPVLVAINQLDLHGESK